MAKPKGIPNRHLHARTTFLYQAATYLTLQAKTSSHKTVPSDSPTEDSANDGKSALALQLGSHLRAVSLKGQVRLSAEMKRSICKTCNAILIPGRTSTHVLENNSNGGKKSWADVLKVKCNVCGSSKRFPVGANRQRRKTERCKQSSSKDYAVTEALTTSTISTTNDQMDDAVAFI